MRYLDIKDRVIEVTHNLEYAPMYLVELYLQDQWELRHAALGTMDLLSQLQHPSIESVVHCMMHYDSRRIHTIRSILVDDVPTFFFIAGGREGGDYFTGYILSTEGLKKYVKYLAVMAIEKWYRESTGYLPGFLPEVEDKDIEVEEMVHVEESTVISGLRGRGSIEYLYGATYTREDDDQWVMEGT